MKMNEDQGVALNRVLRMVSRLFELPAVFIASHSSGYQTCIFEGLTEELGYLKEAQYSSDCYPQAGMHKDPCIISDGEGLSDGSLNGVRFYAGVPLISKQGHNLGTLAIIDAKPKTFASKDIDLLMEFGELILIQIELQEEIELRIQTEKLLKDSEARYKTLVELSPEMIDVRHEGTFLYMNPAGVHLLEAGSQDQVIGKSILDFLHPDYWKAVTQHGEVFEEAKMPSQKTVEKFVTLDGRSLDIEVKSTRIPYDGKSAILAVSRDITKQKRTEQNLLKVNEQLAEIATIDGLTGVSNRRRLDDFLKSEWSRSIRNSTQLSLIMLDIDYFKSYNENYGHLIGDECLIAVAQAIREGLSRPSDFLARYGGEQFSVILPETHLEGAMFVAERIRKQIEDLAIPYHQSKLAKIITVSVGVSTLMGNIFTDSTKLIETADKALYASKRNGRNQVSSYKFE